MKGTVKLFMMKDPSSKTWLQWKELRERGWSRKTKLVRLLPWQQYTRKLHTELLMIVRKTEMLSDLLQELLMRKMSSVVLNKKLVVP